MYKMTVESENGRSLCRLGECAPVYGMALTQNQNQQKISNNLNPVSKTPEHKSPIFIPVDQELLNYFYFIILSCIL